MKDVLILVTLYLLMTTSFFMFAEEKEKNFSLYASFNQSIKSGEALPLPGIGINYLHSRNWSLGFLINLFSHEIKEESFKVFEIGQRVHYVFRLYHPFYLEVGPRVSYLRPLGKNGRFNLASHKEFGPLFSVAPELSFVYKSVVNSFLLKSTLGYWLSPGDLRFHSLVFSISLGLKL